MLKSKHLERFQRLESHGSEILRGNRMLVELIEKEELKTAGGLIIANVESDHRTDTEVNRPTMAIVLAVGPGYYDDKTGKDVPLDLQPGNVVLLSQMGLKILTEVPGYSAYVRSKNDTIALTRDSEVHLKWKSAKDYEAYKQLLNA